jgi:pimeloyl-ACP methyl ester carboxylesterase
MNRKAVAVVGAVGLLLAVLVSACGSRPPPDVVKAPVQVVRVSWGVIGYRTVGQGRPLVLLVGAPGSIDDWTPALVDDLARGARVYAMDYEGIGRTTLRNGGWGFTIPRLADDTADFIRALHLGQVDVMGWSFGSWVAQVLAVRHPTLVRRLVLAATALGDGHASIKNISPPAHFNANYPDSGGFPYTAKGRAAAIAYDHAVHAYPDYNTEERIGVVMTLEGQTHWLDGLVKEGHMAATINAPTLVGDGSQDIFLPLPDSPDVAKAIPHATLKLYPDAGHDFLFQHEADWSHLVLHFLNSP